MTSLRPFRDDPALWLALAVLAAFVLAAVFAPALVSVDPMRQSLLLRLKPPGSTGPEGMMFLLGSDELGRDLWSRMVYGLRLTLLIAGAASLVSALLGTFIGGLAGWTGGWRDSLAMRLADANLSIPTLMLAVFVLAVVGPGHLPLVGVLALARWPRYARIARAETLRLRAKSFVMAAQLAGTSSAAILARHILPNAIAPLIVLFASEFGLMILFEAGLTFLGLGIQPPTPALGAMLASGRIYLDRAWWLTACPGTVVVLLVLALTIVADRLRVRLDPHLAGR